MARFSKKQLNGMLNFAISEAERSADLSSLPQLVVKFKDPDFPFRWIAEHDGALQVCERRNWTPVVTVLPRKWFQCQT